MSFLTILQIILCSCNRETQRERMSVCGNKGATLSGALWFGSEVKSCFSSSCLGVRGKGP